LRHRGKVYSTPNAPSLSSTPGLHGHELADMLRKLRRPAGGASTTRPLLWAAQVVPPFTISHAAERMGSLCQLSNRHARKFRATSTERHKSRCEQARRTLHHLWPFETKKCPARYLGRSNTRRVLHHLPTVYPQDCISDLTGIYWMKLASYHLIHTGERQ
jgi:hypothetical protein